jgi:hypothetical protein
MISSGQHAVLLDHVNHITRVQAVFLAQMSRDRHLAFAVQHHGMLPCCE